MRNEKRVTKSDFEDHVISLKKKHTQIFEKQKKTSKMPSYDLFEKKTTKKILVFPKIGAGPPNHPFL